MASRNYTQSNNTNCFYTQYLPDYQLPVPTEFINLENIVFSEQIESNFQKASKKIVKSGQEDSKKVMRKKHNRARNPWTPQEDLKLSELMKKHGQSWAMISAQMEGRSGKQIRDRFLNKLRPGLKLGDWTPAEDDLMVKLLNEIGNRWSLIATHLPGRTEGQVKNRYYSSIKKRLETSGAAFSQTSAASTLSETVSSFATSPQAEEPKFDFGFDFDANMMNSFNQEPIVNSINNQPIYMVNKGAYVFEEETFSDNITQSPVSQNDPASMVSYELGQQSDFFLPTIENDNQVDDMLDKVTNYFLGNSSPASDVDSYFSDDLKCQQKSAVLAQEADTNEKMALLARRKAYLELALAKTLKEMKSF